MWGFFFLNNVNYCFELYFKIKENKSKFSKEFDKCYYKILNNEARIEIHNQLSQFLQCSCSPLRAFACSLVSYVRIQSNVKDFMIPYIQGAKKIFIHEIPDLSHEYIKALKKNTYCTDVIIKKFTPGDIFPDLSVCCSLTSVRIENFVQDRYIGHDCFERIDYADEEKEKLLQSLSNISSLSHLSMPHFPFADKKLKILEKISNLKTLTIASVMNPKYEKKKFNESKKEKGIKEAFNIINFFKNLKNLEKLEIQRDHFFSTACSQYYKMHNDIPAIVHWNLKKTLERKYYNFIRKRFLEDPSWPQIEFLSKEYDVIKFQNDYTKEVFQLIVLKQLPLHIEDFCKLINVPGQNTIIKIGVGDPIKYLIFLHDLNIDHKKIKGLVINTAKPTHINTDLLSKYQNLFLSLLIKERKKMYKAESVFVLEDKEFPTISWLRSNDYKLLIKNKNNFPNLINFCYQHCDFSSFTSTYWKNRNIDKDYARYVIFESLKNNNVLFWNNTNYENPKRSTSYDSLIPCNVLMAILFKKFNFVDKEKIIKRLEKIQITYEELQSLEIFLKYPYDQIPHVLKSSLSDFAKITDVSNWQAVQDKYLPIIQEQIEVKKPIIHILSNIFNSINPISLSANNVSTIGDDKKENVVNYNSASNHWLLKLYAGMTTIMICLLLYPKTRIKMFGALKTLLNIDLFDHYTKTTDELINEVY